MSATGNPPKKEAKEITERDYESLLEEHCRAIREHVALLERDHDCMTSEAIRVTSRLMQAKQKIIDAERRLKAKLASNQDALMSALADALEICRKHGLHDQIVHLSELQQSVRLAHTKPRNPSIMHRARWN